jgi:hypothetical protein
MRFSAILLGTALLLLAPAAVARDAIDEEIRLAIGSQDIPGQARTLARLAWSDGSDSHKLPARARDRLITYGALGMQAISEALQWAGSERSADIILALIEAERHMTSGMSTYMVAGLDYAIWFGSPDAQRVAMVHMAMRPIPILLLSVIDSAYEHPPLTPVVIETVERIGDDRARFFLAEQMEKGSTTNRGLAAGAMATIGGQCTQYLQAWTLSEEPELREIALRALLPRTTIGDLTTLYEYVAMFPDDDATLLAELRSRAQVLEEMFERQQRFDSASPQLDD